jgi:hypothetical protein
MMQMDRERRILEEGQVNPLYFISIQDQMGDDS